jgi:hypothetical protein
MLLLDGAVFSSVATPPVVGPEYRPLRQCRDVLDECVSSLCLLQTLSLHAMLGHLAVA